MSNCVITRDVAGLCGSDRPGYLIRFGATVPFFVPDDEAGAEHMLDGSACQLHSDGRLASAFSRARIEMLANALAAIWNVPPGAADR